MAKLGPLTKTATALDVIFPIVAATLDDVRRLLLDEPCNGLDLARSDVAVTLQAKTGRQAVELPVVLSARSKAKNRRQA